MYKPLNIGNSFWVSIHVTLNIATINNFIPNSFFSAINMIYSIVPKYFIGIKLNSLKFNITTLHR